MYQQQPSRQPRQNSSNMQQRGGNLPQQPRQPPQQQQQMAMSNMPMVPSMNQQGYAHMYSYQTPHMYPYPLNQYQHQYVTVVPQGAGMMQTQPQMPLPMTQQTRYQAPMATPRMFQPRQPVVHQQKRSRAIPIVDPNTLQEVNLGEAAAAAAAAAALEESNSQQVNGDDEPKVEGPSTQADEDEPQIVNGSEADEKQEDQTVSENTEKPEMKTETLVAQEPKTANPSQNPGQETKHSKPSKPQRGSRQEDSRPKSPVITPEPTSSSKSPEPSSTQPTPTSSRESPVQEPEDDGDWQEAKVRSKKKKSDARPVPEKQPERQQQRRKDFDKKGLKGKPMAAATAKSAAEKPADTVAPAPPPILSYKDKVLGKRDGKKVQESVIELKSEESETPDLSPKEEVKVELSEEIEIVKEEVIKEEPVIKEEEKKPDIEHITVKSPEIPVEVIIEHNDNKLVVEKSKEESKEKLDNSKEVVHEKEKLVEKLEEPVKHSTERIKVKEPESETVEVPKEAAPVPQDVPQIEIKSETPIPEADSSEPPIPDEKPALKLYRSSSMDDLVYAEDQWSPQNQEGKKKYESDFLKKLQNVSLCMKLPENVNLPKNIVREANREFRPVGGGFSFGKENNLMPSFAPFSPKRDPRRMFDGTPKIVKSISLSADVKLNESENAWKPTKRQKDDEDLDKSETEDLMKKVRSILNKLTPEKFDKLMGQVKEMKIDTMEKLEGVINLVFLKAIDEPSFSHVYAKMCHDLSTYVRLRTDEEGQTVISFKRLLIARCQQEYERQNQEEDVKKREDELKKIEDAEGDDKKELRLRLEEADRKKRVRYVGVNRFIAELYQRALLKPNIMLRCISELLSDQSEECIECMCKIVTTIGQDLEEKGISLKEPIDKIKELVNKKLTSTRIRFMMQDVVELRDNKWKPRREVAKPKTMEEIAAEAKKEAAAVPPASPMPPMSNHRGGTPGRGGMDRRDDKMNRGTPRPMKPLANTPFDAKKLSGLTMNTEVSLGRPSFGQWQGGSGMPKSKNMFTVLDDDKSGGSGVPKSKNMFTLLDDDKSGDFDGPNNNYSKSKQPPRL